MVKEPWGVSAAGGLLERVPPPHPINATSMAKASSRQEPRRRLCAMAGASTRPKNSGTWGNSRPGADGGRLWAVLGPVVCRVRVAARGSLPSNAPELGVTVQVEAAGAPAQETLTVPAKPFSGVSLIWVVKACPATIVACVELMVNV